MADWNEREIKEAQRLSSQLGWSRPHIKAGASQMNQCNHSSTPCIDWASGVVRGFNSRGTCVRRQGSPIVRAKPFVRNPRNTECMQVMFSNLLGHLARDNVGRSGIQRKCLGLQWCLGSPLVATLFQERLPRTQNGGTLLVETCLVSNQKGLPLQTCCQGFPF